MLAFTARAPLGLAFSAKQTPQIRTKRPGVFPTPKRLLGGEYRATALLSAQEDLKGTHSRLQEIIENAGHFPFSLQCPTVNLAG